MILIPVSSESGRMRRAGYPSNCSVVFLPEEKKILQENKGDIERRNL
jgi:hypothetical protein